MSWYKQSQNDNDKLLTSMRAAARNKFQEVWNMLKDEKAKKDFHNWLALRIGTTTDRCRADLFDLETCRRALSLMETRRNQLRGRDSCGRLPDPNQGTLKLD